MTRQEKQPEYVFVGSDEMLDACRILTQQKGLSAIYVKKIDYPKVVDGDKRDLLRIVVFDPSVFRYEEMMCQLPDNHYIGTYHLQTKALITPWEVIR